MISRYDHNDGAYALFLQYGRYRDALREAIRGYRRDPTEIWRLRVWGCFKRRNEH